MTPTQKIQVAQSETRTQIASVLDTEVDKRAETWETDLEGLTKRAKSLEIELRAALVAGEDKDDESTTVESTTVETTTDESVEDRERRELSESIDFGEYLGAAMYGKAVSGKEAEYNDEYGYAADQFPLELLTRDLDPDPELEKRAAVDTVARTNQGAWVDRLFSETAARKLGVTFPSVAPGVASYAVTTGGGAPKQRGRTQAAAVGTYAFDVTELKPTRNAVHGVYSVEDNARLPGMADAIMRDMRNAMVERIDRVIFVGDDGANEAGADITGLTTAAITEVTLTQAAKVKGDEWLKLLAALVDGKHAASMADLNLVFSVGANVLTLGTIHNSAASNDTVAQFLRANGATWTTRGDIETASANGDFGAFVGLARGQRGTAVAPIWSAASLIRDPYTGAKSGEVQLTLSYLWGFAIPRTANYRRLKFVN